VQSKLFVTIISSNTTKIGIQKGDEERRNEQSLLRKISGLGSVWMVPYGSAGLLRLGGLEAKPFPPTISDSISTHSEPSGVLTPAKNQFSNSAIPFSNPIHWLALKEESLVPDKITLITEKFRAQGATQFDSFVKLRGSKFLESKFAGAESCSNCHSKTYEIWKNSKHSKALETLQLKQRHEDLTCIECHVVGFHADAGYVNQKVSPNLAGVQCENCHGPAKEHLANPNIKPKSMPHAAPFTGV
jgi:Zn finger protein HypA/HybF involved in hydrogenase expression